MQWTTKELRYLEAHANEGALAIAHALGRTPEAVKMQAYRCGVSLRRREVCPRCGRTTFKPLNRINGWCMECTKEEHAAELARQAMAMREEAARKLRNDRVRQRHYSAKNRAKKKKSTET